MANIVRTPTGQFQKGFSGNPGGKTGLLDEVRDLARQETAASIKALAEIRDNKKEPAQARVAASCALLDRGWGKPAQTVIAEITERFAFEFPREAESEEEWLELTATKLLPQ